MADPHPAEEAAEDNLPDPAVTMPPRENETPPEPAAAPAPLDPVKEAVFNALKKRISALLAKTTLERGKRLQFQSMALHAYREKDFQPLWQTPAGPGEILASLRVFIGYHGFKLEEAALSFQGPNIEAGEAPALPSVNPADSSAAIAEADLIVTLGLAEACLRLKQGTPAVAEWPHWYDSDLPIDQSESQHYNAMAANFGKLAAASSDPIRVAEAFVPKNWVYDRIHRQFLQVDQGPQPPQIVLDKLVKTGDALPQAGELAAYFHKTGRIPEDALDNPGSLYTQTLSSAVKAYQAEKGLQSDGILGPKTAQHLASRKEIEKEALYLNLHRARRLPDDLGARHLLANIPAGEIYGFDNGIETLRMRIVFGKNKPTHRTPIFRDKMEEIVFRPYWNVPYNIAVSESIYQDPAYLASNNFKILSNTGSSLPLDPAGIAAVTARQGYIRQEAGKNNALGLVKFLFPNKHSVYFHDTPYKHYFEDAYRAQSHGCVRLQKPALMAEWLLAGSPDWNAERIRKAMNEGEQTIVKLEKHIPVYITYFTAFPDSQSKEGVLFYRDYYGYDAPGALVDAPPAPVLPPSVTSSQVEETAPSEADKKRPSIFNFKRPDSATGTKRGAGFLERLRAMR